MTLIKELYRPEVGMLPVGGSYTMSPYEAAYAAKLLGVEAVVPMHFGTSPALAGTPAQLREEPAGNGIEVEDLEPGQTLS